MCAVLAVAWFGMVTQSGHALFSDTATLTDNMVTTGSVDLQVSNSQSGSSTLFADARMGFEYTLNPGESAEKYFLLKNISTSSLSLDIAVSVAQYSGDASFSPMLQLEFTPVDSTGVETGPAKVTTLAAMVSAPVSLGVKVEGGKTQRFKLKTILAAEYASPQQSVTYQLVFTGTQHLEA